MTESKYASVIGGAADELLKFSGMLYWKKEADEIILVDPRHIRVLIYQEKKDGEGNTAYVVMADVGTGQPLVFARREKAEVMAWFEACQKAKMVN